MSPAWVGAQPSTFRVRVLDAGMEMAADHLGDLARRETSSPTACVIEPAWRLVQRQAHHAGIESVHHRPAVGDVADVAGPAPIPRDADERRDETVVAVPMHRRDASGLDRNPRQASAKLGPAMAQEAVELILWEGFPLVRAGLASR